MRILDWWDRNQRGWVRGRSQIGHTSQRGTGNLRGIVFPSQDRGSRRPLPPKEVACNLEKLFQIPPLGITGRVIGEKSKYKQSNKEGNNNIYGNLQRSHTMVSKSVKVLSTAAFTPGKHSSQGKMLDYQAFYDWRCASSE